MAVVNKGVRAQGLWLGRKRQSAATSNCETAPAWKWWAWPKTANIINLDRRSAMGLVSYPSCRLRSSTTWMVVVGPRLLYGRSRAPYGCVATGRAAASMRGAAVPTINTRMRTLDGFVFSPARIATLALEFWGALLAMLSATGHLRDGGLFWSASDCANSASASRLARSAKEALRVASRLHPSGCWHMAPSRDCCQRLAAGKVLAYIEVRGDAVDWLVMGRRAIDDAGARLDGPAGFRHNAPGPQAC